MFFCPAQKIKKFRHPKVKYEYTVSLRGDVEAVAMKQICIHYEMYKEKKKTRENLESSMKCTKKRKRQKRTPRIQYAIYKEKNPV